MGSPRSNRNDNDHDGVEDYLGTYSQDLRDDKNGVLGALAYDPSSGTAFSISRSGPPAFDSAVTRRDLERRLFRAADRHRIHRPRPAR